MEIPVLISLLVAAVPFLAALTDRRKVHGDLTVQIVDIVKKSIDMREEDIVYLERKLVECRAESLHKSEYHEYLWHWIKAHSKTKLRPRTFEKFKIRTPPRQ